MQIESAATVGHWWWDPEMKRLRIEPDKHAALDDLGGTWTLNALGVILDGFSRSRLERALDFSNGAKRDVACAIGLSKGGAVHLVGHFDAKGAASGDLLQDDLSEAYSHILAPGPGLDAAFQPIVSLSSGRIAGFEALARWGGAPPGHQSGDVGLADDALAPNMLIRASEALGSWQKAGHTGLFVNVNLTGRDLAREDLPGLIEALISGHGFEPGQLRIELTEQAALRDGQEAIRVAEALKKAGAGVILDDFGSGHSSFSWLAALPADGLKIDPELTRQIDSEKVRVILETMTLLASRLKMSATAEGIEKLEQIGLLRTLGFHYAQGFAFSHPISAVEAGKLLNVSD
ncbi:EAL domain-containing protein [Henriciella sp.]|uniref:EAL domain-containing protein n=1 Tax=Henriciella sp. TaxID=1968823 RepID=UPI002603803E|nr:EAL domain-containing protein [Henriciella sp.]